MTYTKLCATTDIDIYFPAMTLSSSTKPSKASVEGWIDQSTVLVYSAVAENYVVPVTNADDLLILKSLCVQYVLEEVSFVLSKTRVAYADNNVIVPRTVTHKVFYNTLEAIRNGSYRLLNTATSSRTVITSYTATNGITAEATKETAQW